MEVLWVWDEFGSGARWRGGPGSRELGSGGVRENGKLMRVGSWGGVVGGSWKWRSWEMGNWDVGGADASEDLSEGELGSWG